MHQRFTSSARAESTTSSRRNRCTWTTHSSRSCFAGDSEAMQGLAIYGMPCVERQWQQNGELPQVTLFEEDEEELASLRERCDWAMQDTASLFAAVDQLLY
mmetsp:Transcript_25154/g.51713  ORF Transcript_25154/g.51713 Transcript_25154/m.51713 type:complete len:101 (-) Transcript_25154:350-652(-)